MYKRGFSKRDKMIFAYILLILLFILDTTPVIKKNPEYNFLSKTETLTINGLFVILVFFRHYKGYVNCDYGLLNHLFVMIDGRSSQLIVTMFLFYSGYGIFESFKKKDKYVSSFFRNRFMPTYLNFALCVSIYLIISIINGEHYTIKENILSFIGWSSCYGNSNWYMFVTFSLYIIFLISFIKAINKFNGLLIYLFLLTILSILFAKYKPHFWYNTLICFYEGMLASYYKEKLILFLLNKKNYFLTLITSSLFFLFTFFLIETQSPLFILKAFFFSTTIFLIQFKVCFESKVIFKNLGKLVFPIYMLQRIPFIIMKNTVLSENIYLFFIATLIITIILSVTYNLLISRTIGFVRNRFFQKRF